MEQYARTELLLGAEGMARLRGARIALFGVGGVGGHAAEALARSGVGAIDLYDNDTVSVSNLNRQLIATRSTIGMYKVDAMKARIHDIDPDVQVGAYRLFYMPENADEVDLSRYDYIVDAIDTVTAKLELIQRADRLGVKIISAMGAGNKLDPGQITITDIYKTSACPLARVMRTELRRRGIKRLTVAYSTEPAIRVNAAEEGQRRSVPGSTAFVPAAMGLIIAGKIVRDIALEGATP